MPSRMLYGGLVQSKVFVVFTSWLFLVIVYLILFFSVTTDHHNFFSSDSIESNMSHIVFSRGHKFYSKEKEKLQDFKTLKEEHRNSSSKNTSINHLKKASNFRELFKVNYDTFSVNFGKGDAGSGNRFLIYRCDSTRMSHCGGWADRIKGMIAGYILANLTGRTFKAEIKSHGCNITDYIVPNHVNWSLPRSFHEEIIERDEVQRVNVIDNRQFYNRVQATDFNTYSGMRAKFVYFKANLDYTDGFKGNKFHAKQLSWMANMTRDQVSGIIFRHLFKLSQGLKEQLDSFLENSLSKSSEKLVCAHIRMGRNPSIPRDSVIRNYPSALPKVWKFITTTLSRNKRSKVFVMSDSMSAIEDAKKQSFSDRLVLIPGEVTHIEKSAGLADKNICKSQVKVVLEQFMLMNCDVLVISKSGLSRMAAYVRGSDVGLFCLVSGKIIPCKMATLKELYRVSG